MMLALKQSIHFPPDRRILRPSLGSRLIALSSADPTRTLGLRRRWSVEMDRRFKAVRREVVAAILTDRFDLYQEGPAPAVHAAADLIPPGPIEGGRYTYRWSRDKAEEFMAWLEDMTNAKVLEMIPRVDFLGGRSEVPWTNMFVDSAYQGGIRAGRAELRAAGETIPDFGDLGPGVGRDIAVVAFNQPIHADRVGLIYSRVFTDLKGVTQVMDTQISRELALGMAEGRNPRDMARSLADRVDKIGITRARLIARTETVRSHNEAKLNEFERVEGMTGDNVLVKWVTAQDERVRDTHRPRHGKIYTRAEARKLIGEPNCRCTLIPYIPALEVGLGEMEREEAKPKMTRRRLPVEIITPVSTAFEQDIIGLLDKVPSEINQKVFEAGWVVKVGAKLTEIFPDLKGVYPRGWPAGTGL